MFFFFFVIFWLGCILLWALPGTCTTIPKLEVARWAVGEFLAIRAFQLCGNATHHAAAQAGALDQQLSALGDLARLVEQWIAGAQTALVSVNGFLGLVLSPWWSLSAWPWRDLWRDVSSPAPWVSVSKSRYRTEQMFPRPRHLRCAADAHAGS